MLAAVASFAAMDALMKLLAGHYPPLQVACLRGTAALPFVLAPIIWRRRLARVKPVNLRLHAVRAVLAVVMLNAFVSAVRDSSLATTYAIFMCAPLLVAVLSAPLLGEKVARAHWVAILVGLGGVLMMLEPGNGRFAFAGAAWAVVAMLAYTASVVTLRVLSRTDSNESMVLWFTLTLAVGAGALAAPEWRAVAAVHAPLVAGVGLTGAIGQYLITLAFRHAPAATVAPFEYTALVWGVALDVAIWNAWPSAVTLAGGAIVIGAGLAVIAQERRLLRR